MNLFGAKGNLSSMINSVRNEEDEKIKKKQMSNYQSIIQNNEAKTPSEATAAYRKNLFQPSVSLSDKWYSGDSPTSRDVLGRIYNISQNNPERASKLYSDYKYLQSDRTSKYYNPYTSATNPAVSNLAAMGVDVSKIDDKWYDNNRWLMDYYNFSGTTTTPTKPGKKASPEEQAAYEYYQLYKSEAATKKAEQEWKALQEEVSYWAKRDDRNYSDQQILDKIDWSKYSTLTDMDEKRTLGTPLELNRGIGYSKDALYGVIWQARNGNPDGVDLETATMYSAAGVGKQWEKNQEIADRLDPQSEKYNPYMLGSTLEQEGVYFNQKDFAPDWGQTHMGNLYGVDKTAANNTQSVISAEKRTATAEEEIQKLNEAMKKKLSRCEDKESCAEEMSKWLDSQISSGRYPTLKELNDSLHDGKTILPTTRALDFGVFDYKQRINAASEANKLKSGTFDLMEGIQADLGVHGDAAGLQHDMRGVNVMCDAPTRNVSQGAAPTNLPTGSDAKGVMPSAAGGTVPEPDGVGAAKGKNVSQGVAVDTGNAGADARGVMPSAGGKPTIQQDAAGNTLNKDVNGDTVGGVVKPQAAGAAGNPATYTKSEKDVIHAKDVLAQDSFDVIEEEANEAESLVAENAGSTLFQMTMEFMKGAIDTALDVSDNLTKRAINNSISQNNTAMLENTGLIAEYERNQKAKQELEEKGYRLRDQLGDLIYAEMSNAPSRMSATITVEGKKIDIVADYSDETGKFNLISMQDHGTDGYDLVTGVNRDALDKAVNNRLASFDEFRQNVMAQHSADLSDEERNQLKEYKNIINQTSNLSEYLDQNQDAYNESVLKRDRAIALRDSTNAMLKMVGADTTEIEKAAAVTNFLTGFTEYDPTEWEAYSAFDDFSWAMQFSSDEGSRESIYNSAKEIDDQVSESLEAAKWVLEYNDGHGIQIPDDVKNNLERYIAKLERTHQEYEYFSQSANPDFDEKAAEGYDIVSQQRFNMDLYESGGLEAQPLWNLLTDDQKKNLEIISQSESPTRVADAFDNAVMEQDLTSGVFGMYKLDKLLTSYEKDTYYYLIATQGFQAANNYYDFLTDESYGVLNTRAAEETQAAGEELARDGLGGAILSNFTSVLLAPAAAISGGIYAIETGLKKMAGEDVEFNPNNIAMTYNLFRGATMSATSEVIKEELGENTFLGKIAQGGLEIFRNRGDSVVNALTFGAICPWMGNISNEMLNEFVGALPMGISAGVDAAAEAKRKGATDEQAYAVAGVTVFAETITEAISLDNIRGALNMGKDIDASTVKDWLKNWLTKAGISEAFGETLNDVIENAADRWIMGENSDHARLVAQYKENGMSDDDAEAAARRDELAGYLHTALISYITPGMDIVGYAAGKFMGYMDTARSMQQNGYDLSVLDVMRMEKEHRQQMTKGESQQTEQIQDPQAAGAPAPARGESTAAPVTAEEQAALAARKAANDSVTRDWRILKTAATANNKGRNACIAAVLNTGKTAETSDAARAAAVRMSSLFGENADTVAEMENLLTGALAADVNPAMVKTAVRNAALGGEQSAAYRVIRSDNFQQAMPDQQARMLAASVEPDSVNADLAKTAAMTVREHRIAEKEFNLMAEGMIPSIEIAKTAEAEAENAAANALEAQTLLEERQKDVETAGDAVRGAGDEHLKALDSGDDNRIAEATNALTHAISEKGKAVEVQSEYEQHLSKAEEQRQAAEAKAQEAARTAAKDVREQATALVDQEDQQREETALQQAELKRQEDEQKALEQQVETENSNIAQLDSEAFISQIAPDATPEERERVRQMMLDEQRQLGQDEAGRRNKFINQIANRFGVKIDVLDTQAEQGFRSNGYYDRDNNRIVLDTNSSTSDAMYFFLGHELTHMAEQAGAYNKLADSLLRLRYGNDASYKKILKAAAAGNGSVAGVADLMGKRAIYDSTLKEGKHSDEYLLQEVVADTMGQLLYPSEGNQQLQEELINRLVAEEPSTARMILESIKNFLKKMVGIKDPSIDSMQHTVDLLNKALSQAQKTESESNTKHALMEFEDGKRFVDLNIDQEQFNGMSLTEMKDLAKKYIKKYFKDRIIGIDNRAYVNGRSAEEYYYTHGRNLSPDEIEAKARASTEIDNLMDAGVFDHHEDDGKDGHTHNNYPGGFDYYKTIFKSGDQFYEALISIGKTKHGDKFHSVSDVKNITQDTMDSYGETPKFHFLRDISVDNVAQDKRTVKPLVTDNQGNDLATEFPGGTVAINTNRKQSLNSFTPEEQKRTRDALLAAKDEDGKRRFTPQQVDQYMSDAMGIASMIAADRTRLDYDVTDPEKSMVKPNADYGASIDASTLCAKRLLYQGTFDAIQHMLPNTPLMPNDLINLANMMRDMGYETPCGICYVESRRRTLGKEAKKWLDNYEGEYKPTIADVTTSDGLETLRNEHKQAYDDFIEAMKNLNQRNPKVVQLRTEYRGEIGDMSDAAVQKAINHGGLRVQSFSDFETPHLLDMIQVVLDMASKGLTSQAYTKVPNFAWAFGDTGMKINLSLIAKGAGVDENGNLLFDDREGMPFDEAMKLRDRYSKNVGTIIVGKNDAHILAAMADDRIDFIIPFHRSGWTKNERNLMETLKGYKDYTNDQNERKILKRKDNGKGYVTVPANKSKIKNLEPVGEKNANGSVHDGYWDFSKSGKENAEEYLRLCAKDGRIPKFSRFLVDNGDGSFSLQPDGSTDGYWKTLIDFKMYDNDGIGSAQTAVTPNINMNQAQRIINDYSLDRNGVRRDSNNSLPVAQPVVDRYVEEYKANHPGRKYSLPNAALMDQDYEDAYNTYDDEEGERLVAEAAEAAMPESKIRDDDGRLKVVYHQTNAVDENGEPFTVFDPEKARTTSDIQGIYFAPEYDKYHEYGDRTYPVYLNIKNPAIDPEGPDLSKTGDGARVMRDLIAQGYDGIINTENGKPYEYIAFYPEQIKSAEAFTEDDDGNLIALSERFNPYQKDIRYSLPSEDILRQQIRQYLRNGGSLSVNSNPPASGDLPGTPGMRPQRQFGRKTAQESGALHQEVKDYLFNHSSYDPDSNQEQIDRAVNWVRGHANQRDEDGYFSALQEVTGDSFDYRSADGQARMLTVMSMAVLKGDIASEMRLADAYNRQGTDLGRQLQARKIFRLMTPLGRQSVLQSEVDKINKEYERKGKTTRVALSEEILNEAGEARTEEDFQKIRRKAAKEIAAQMPANWKEKLQSWRMLAMLANPRTHIRNVVGNAMFMPAVAMKNKIGAVSEIVSRQSERTKTLGLASSEARAFAKKDAAAIRDVLTGEAKYNDSNMVQQERKVFKNKALQGISDFNSKALEGEDWIFLQRHYRNALAGYMTANKLTEEDMTGATLERARAYAVEEAQKATYRDASKLASKLSQLGREGGAVGFAVNAVLPFKKTPINILKRGVEYSPAGLLKALSVDAYHLKQYNDWQSGKLSGKPEKAISPTQWIDRLASGLTGTGIVALGAMLCGMGVVGAGFGDDEDEFDRLEGDQEYSLKLHLFGQDVSYTIDWAAPSCMPFFVGATLYDAITREAGGDVDIGYIADAILNITEPVFNLSMLDGVNSLLDVSQYAEGNAITQIGEKVLTNYASSYVPTVAGQIARTIDTTRRKSYVESGAKLSQFLYAQEQLENKIPWLSKTNIPYRNAWGEADVSSTGWAVIENFLSPGYGQRIEHDPVTEELRRLYQVTGDKTMIPKLPSKTLSVSGESTKLNAEQYDQLTVERGQTAKKTLAALMETNEYQIADDETRAEMVGDVWTYANQTANSRIDSNANKAQWVASAESSGNPVSAVINRASERNKKEYVTGHKESMLQSLEDGDIETAMTSMEALREAGKEDKDIKTMITTYFKPIYQKAANGDDWDTMDEIELILGELDLNYSEKTFSSWRKGMEEEDLDDEEEEDFSRWMNRKNR